MGSRPFGTVEAKNGRWRARYNAPDGTRPTKTFPDNAKGRARAWLAQQETAIVAGTWKSSRQIADEKAAADLVATQHALTVSEFADEWLRRLETLGRTPKTVQTHTYRLAKHVRPTLGSRPLTGLTSRELRGPRTGCCSAVIPEVYCALLRGRAQHSRAPN